MGREGRNIKQLVAHYGIQTPYRKNNKTENNAFYWIMKMIIQNSVSIQTNSYSIPFYITKTIFLLELIIMIILI